MSLRLVALWLVLVAAYAATLGVDAVPGARHAGDEVRYLLTAEAIVRDGSLTVAARGGGAAYDALGFGFPALIAPAYALGGAAAVGWLMAGLTALGLVLAAAVARRVVPEPWASLSAALVGLSPPVLAAATRVEPGAVAGTLLAGAALCALSVRGRPQAGATVAGALMLAALPWLGPQYVLPGLPLAWALVRFSGEAGGRLAALMAGEVMAGSLVFYATLNDRLYGGLTPFAAAPPGASATGLDGAGDLLGRIPRLALLWLDGEAGLLRWAPVLALAGLGAWALWRSHRERLGTVLPARRAAELATALALAVVGIQLVVATLLAPDWHGTWFPGRTLAPALPLAAVPVAWGLRRAPRIGAALAALTLLASAWLGVGFATGALTSWDAAQRSAAPLGPLSGVLPWAAVAAVAAAAAAQSRAAER